MTRLQNIAKFNQSIGEPSSFNDGKLTVSLVGTANNISSAGTDQEFTEACQQSIIRNAQSMSNQDRLDSFKPLREAVKRSKITSKHLADREIQKLCQVMETEDPVSASLLEKLAQLGFLDPNNSVVNPAGYYFICEELKTVYCSIPKNACTLFKNMLVDNSDLKANV